MIRSGFSCLVLALLSCGGNATAERGELGAPSEAEAVEPEEVEPPSIATQEAFDVRRIRIEPMAHINQRRLCDLAFVGGIAPIENQDAHRYATSARTRVSIQCRSVTGDGWADLVLGPDHAGLPHELAPGQRIEVKVLAATGGILDYPVVEFVEAKGAAADHEQPESVPRVTPGFDFSRVTRESALLGTSRSCGCVFAGPIELVDEATRARRGYPGGTQNRMTIRCKSAERDTYLDLTFTPSTAPAALAVHPGATLNLQVVSPAGGFADFPVATLAG